MLRLTLIVCLLFSSACSMTSVRHRQGFEKALHHKTIAVMPPEIKVNMVGAFGAKERQHNYEERLEELLVNELSGILKAKGYKIQVVSRRILGETKNFDIYEDIKDSIDQVSEELYKPAIMMQEDKAYNIDNKIQEPAARINKLAKGQIILFVDYINNVATNGSRIVSVLAGGNQAVDSSVILLVFLDTNGNVLWSNMARVDKGLGADLFSFDNHDKRDAKHLHGILVAALKDFPSKQD